MSCSRLGVEVNSPGCTAQNSTTTVKFGACSTVLIPRLPNELAQVIDGPEFSPDNSAFRIFCYVTGWSYYRGMCQPEILLILLMISLELQCALCRIPGVSCMLTAHTDRQLSLQRPVVTICTTSLTFNNFTFCPHSVFICFVWIWEQTRLFPCTTLTDWFYNRDFNPLKSSGHYMYHHFNSQKFYVLPTQCIYVFCVDLRTNSDYFPIQH